MLLMGSAAALCAGVARAMARTANARVAADVGVARSTLYNFAVGLVCSVVAWLALSSAPAADMLATAAAPPWAYIGGALGVLFVVCSNLAAPRMSSFVMTLLILVGQIAAGLVLDGLLRGHVAPLQIVGCVLLFAGLAWDVAASRRTAGAGKGHDPRTARAGSDAGISGSKMWKQA